MYVCVYIYIYIYIHISPDYQFRQPQHYPDYQKHQSAKFLGLVSGVPILGTTRTHPTPTTPSLTNVYDCVNQFRAICLINSRGGGWHGSGVPIPWVIALGIALIGRTLEAPIPKMSGLVKKISPFSKRKNPL